MAKIILFDGTSTEMWTKRDGSPIAWTIEDGVLTVGRDPGEFTSDIVSTVKYGDAHIHVEWREPDMPDAIGQDKGNSGVYIHGAYELQVLDCYGLGKLADNECGAIYSVYPPLTNACKPAMEWQTYDIYFRAPRFNEDGSVKENARATILQNGICIQNNIDLYTTTPGGVTEQKLAEGPLLLQDHLNPVSFRNIWIETL